MIEHSVILASGIFDDPSKLRGREAFAWAFGKMGSNSFTIEQIGGTETTVRLHLLEYMGEIAA